MKKLIVATTLSLIVLALAAAVFIGIYNINKEFDYYAKPSPISIEQTYWYLKNEDNGIPSYYLYIKAVNTSNRDIKSVKSHCGFDMFWYDESGKFGGSSGSSEAQVPWGNIIQLDWPIDGYWKAGEREIFRIPVMSIEYDDYGTKCMVHTLLNGAIMPYWVDFTGFGSWGEKDFHVFDTRVNHPFIARHATQIPDFRLLENS